MKQMASFVIDRAFLAMTRPRRKETMKKYALLVIDCQNYFFERSSPAYLPDSNKIISKINLLIEMARKKKWPVIYTSHTAPSKPGNLMAEQWEHLPSGWESELYDKLNIASGSHKLKKEYFSAFFKTRLDSLLKRKNIDNLVICGVMTHLCVDTTVRHGFMLGYRSILVSDACCSKSPAYHRAAVLALKHGFSRLMTAKQFIGAIADENI